MVGWSATTYPTDEIAISTTSRRAARIPCCRRTAARGLVFKFGHVCKTWPPLRTLLQAKTSPSEEQARHRNKVARQADHILHCVRQTLQTNQPQEMAAAPAQDPLSIPRAAWTSLKARFVDTPHAGLPLPAEELNILLTTVQQQLAHNPNVDTIALLTSVLERWTDRAECLSIRKRLEKEAMQTSARRLLFPWVDFDKGELPYIESMDQFAGRYWIQIIGWTWTEQRRSFQAQQEEKKDVTAAASPMKPMDAAIKRPQPSALPTTVVPPPVERKSQQQSSPAANNSRDDAWTKAIRWHLQWLRESANGPLSPDGVEDVETWRLFSEEWAIGAHQRSCDAFTIVSSAWPEWVHFNCMFPTNAKRPPHIHATIGRAFGEAWTDVYQPAESMPTTASFDVKTMEHVDVPDRLLMFTEDATLHPLERLQMGRFAWAWWYGAGRAEASMQDKIAHVGVQSSWCAFKRRYHNDWASTVQADSCVETGGFNMGRTWAIRHQLRPMGRTATDHVLHIYVTAWWKAAGKPDVPLENKLKSDAWHVDFLFWTDQDGQRETDTDAETAGRHDGQRHAALERLSNAIESENRWDSTMSAQARPGWISDGAAAASDASAEHKEPSPSSHTEPDLAQRVFTVCRAYHPPSARLPDEWPEAVLTLVDVLGRAPTNTSLRIVYGKRYLRLDKHQTYAWRDPFDDDGDDLMLTDVMDAVMSRHVTALLIDGSCVWGNE